MPRGGPRVQARTAGRLEFCDRLLAEGHSRAHIAYRLGITRGTLDNYLRRHGRTVQPPTATPVAVLPDGVAVYACSGCGRHAVTRSAYRRPDMRARYALYSGRGECGACTTARWRREHPRPVKRPTRRLRPGLDADAYGLALTVAAAERWPAVIRRELLDMLGLLDGQVG